MNRVLTVQGRELLPADVEQVRELVAHHPDWSRRRLSEELAALWEWRTATGQLKDMAARTLMLKLAARNVLELPPRRQPAWRRRLVPTQPTLWEPEEPTPVESSLGELAPVRMEVVKPGMAQYKRVEMYLARHHYLGYRGPVGENIAYLAFDRGGRDVGCLLFGAAAWRTRARDELIGWDDATRARRLSWITNNTRYLVLPWVRVPHLASHLLGQVVRRLNRDWEGKYGHPVHLVETYVDRQRFKGTCYRAANWKRIGQTRGRSRQDTHKKLKVPVKDIYVYPLTPRFRERLRAEDREMARTCEGLRIENNDLRLAVLHRQGP